MPSTLIATLVTAGVLAAAMTRSLMRQDRETRGGWARAGLWAETFVALFIMVAMLFATLLQVIVRHHYSAVLDFSWTEELARLLLIWMTFWVAAIVQRRGRHLDVSVVSDLLPARAQQVLRRLVDGVVLVILGVVAVEGFRAARLLLGQSTIALDAPMAVFAVSVPIGIALMFIHLVIDIARGARGGGAGEA